MHSLGPRYILQPGKGFQFHTPEFDRGYVDGFCSIAGPNYSSDADEAPLTVHMDQVQPLGNKMKRKIILLYFLQLIALVFAELV